MGQTIYLEWQAPIQITSRGRMCGTADELAKAIESKPGVYVYTRKHGKRFVPFYIGQSENLNQRFKQHLKSNVALMKVIEGYGSDVAHIGHGDRYLQYAFLNRRQRQNVGACLDIVERAMIRKAITDEHLILNTHLVKIDQHQIVSDGPKPHRAILGKTNSVEAKT